MMHPLRMMMCGLCLALMSATVLRAEEPSAQAADVAGFDSLERLQRHFDGERESAMRALEARRLAALEAYLASADEPEHEAVVRAMIHSAELLGRFEQVVALTGEFIERYGGRSDVWSIRDARFAALVELGRVDQARAEWEVHTNPLKMEHWREVLFAGLVIGEGYADVGRAEDLRALHALMRDRLSAVPQVSMILGQFADGLDWVGKRAPPLEGEDIDGRPLDMAEYEGKVLLIDFWATNCPPCIAALPELIETYEKYRDKGFEIVGISLDTNRAVLERFLDRRELPWRQVYDGRSYRSTNARNYEVRAIPATFLVNRDGRIVRAGVPLKGFEPVVRRLVNETGSSSGQACPDQPSTPR